MQRLKFKWTRSLARFGLIFCWVPGCSIPNEALPSSYLFQLNQNIYFYKQKGKWVWIRYIYAITVPNANYMSLHEQINNICTYIYQSCLWGKERRKQRESKLLYGVKQKETHCLSSVKPQTPRIKINYARMTWHLYNYLQSFSHFIK